MEIKDATIQVLPYVKKFLIDNRDKLEQDVNDWLKLKGKIIGFVGPAFFGVLFNILIGPLLPFVLDIVLKVLCGMFAPYLLPFLPLIERLVDYINDKYLSDIEKQALLEIIHLIVGAPKLAELDGVQKIQLMTNQEYFP